jgi:hypothetical protein
MANRYKVPNLNVNYFLCGQGCARNEAADGNAGGRREGAKVCDTFWGVEKPVLVSGCSVQALVFLMFLREDYYSII